MYEADPPYLMSSKKPNEKVTQIWLRIVFASPVFASSELPQLFANLKKLLDGKSSRETKKIF